MDKALRQAAAKERPTVKPVEGARIEKNTVFPVACSCSGNPKDGFMFHIAPLAAKSKADFEEWLKAHGIYDAKAFMGDLKKKKATLKVGGIPGPVINVSFK